MGVDIYLEPAFSRNREAHEPEFDRAVARRDVLDLCGHRDPQLDCARCAAEEEVGRAWEAMYPDRYYIRSSYNPTSLFGWIQANFELDLMALLEEWLEERPGQEPERAILRVREFGYALGVALSTAVAANAERILKDGSVARFHGPQLLKDLVVHMALTAEEGGELAPGGSFDDHPLTVEETGWYLHEVLGLARFADACRGAEAGSYIVVSA